MTQYPLASLKPCTMCKRSFPPTTQYFHVRSANTDGLRNQCKECSNASHRTHSRSEKYTHDAPLATIKENVPDGYKKCRRCQAIKPISREYFHISKTNTAGFHPLCKDCRSILRRVRPPVGPIPDGYKQCAQCRQAKPATPEYFIRNKSLPGGLNSYCKECWHQRYNTNENRIDGRKRTQTYRVNHPERTRIIRRNYDARHRQAQGHYTEKDIQLQYERQKGKCYYCHKKVDKHYHVDHIIPLARGGTNWPDNLVIACRTCNASKGKSLPHEWVKGGHLI